MIRILLPQYVYPTERIALLERTMTSLQMKTHKHVKRVNGLLNKDEDRFYEGFLENETKLHVAAIRLTDQARFVMQEHYEDMATYLIEDEHDIAY